jgi:uncharacterized membrane protein
MAALTAQTEQVICANAIRLFQISAIALSCNVRHARRSAPYNNSKSAPHRALSSSSYLDPAHILVRRARCVYGPRSSQENVTMMVAIVVVQWLHVLLAVYWFGGTIYLNTIVVPSLLKMPLAQQRPVTFAIGQASNKIFPIVQTLVIVFGFIRGTVLGPISSFADLASPYGIRFSVSLLLTIGLAAFAHGVTGRAARKLGDFPLEEIAKGGPVAEAYAAQTQRIKTYVVLQLVGFLVIFTLMILMRIGM